MKIQVNTDRNIQGSEELVAEIEATVTDSLGHYTANITRVEVHLSDENGGKQGHDDKRCVMEARVEGRQPTAVTCDASSVSEAVTGAATKLKHALASTMERLREHR